MAGLKKERWMPVVGFEGYYSVSDRGQVRSETRVVARCSGGSHYVQGRILKTPLSVRGYAVASLWANGIGTMKNVHRLMLEAFDRPMFAGDVCRHLNGDKTDNSLENLRWGTQKENGADSVRHGVIPRGEEHHGALLTVDHVVEIRRSSASSYELAKRFDVHPRTIRDARNRITWRHIK